MNLKSTLMSEVALSRGFPLATGTISAISGRFDIGSGGYRTQPEADFHDIRASILTAGETSIIEALDTTILTAGEPASPDNGNWRDQTFRITGGHRKQRITMPHSGRRSERVSLL